MKRSAEFLLRQVAGKNVVVPVGNAAVSFNGMLTLNATGVFLWEQLEQDMTEGALVEALCGKYDVSRELAAKDVRTFVEKLVSVKAITE